jgi:hypothetical protein
VNGHVAGEFGDVLAAPVIAPHIVAFRGAHLKKLMGVGIELGKGFLSFVVQRIEEWWTTVQRHAQVLRWV